MPSRPTYTSLDTFVLCSLQMPEITKKSQPPDSSLATDQVEDFSTLDTHITPDDKFCGMKPPANPFMSPYLLMFIPGINFVFEFYNNSKPPSPNTLKEVLNMIVIVSTLLFAVVVTMPFGFQHDELVDYVNLWRKGGVYDGLAKEALEVDGYEFTEADYARPVTRFVAESVYATGLLFATLIVSIIMYVSLATASFRDADGKINLRMLGAWWSVARFALLMVLALLVSGIWYFQSAVYWAYDVRASTCAPRIFLVGTAAPVPLRDRAVACLPFHVVCTCSVGTRFASARVWTRSSILTFAASNR